jgi:Icc protein
MTLRLLQLSDCHLQPDPAEPYRGINPELHLQRMLAVARDWQPDLLVLSGDLVERAQAKVYQRLNDMMQETGIPTLAFPGNHDDPKLLREHLQASVFDHGNPQQHDGWQLLWLDSNVPGQPHGILDAERLGQLSQLDPDLPTLLFMHHQPMPVGTPWIDRFDCRDSDVLWQWLNQHPHNVRAICFGHIHHGWQGEKRIGGRRIALLGAPSTSACVIPGSTSFALDVRGPRMRWLQLAADGGVRTGLLSSA